MSKKIEDWIYNEFIHCGVNYSNKEVSEEYDKNHQKFRNYKKEFEEILSFVDIKNSKDKVLIDLGCGTGALTINASDYFKKIFAIDVSDEMINQAKLKQRDCNVNNIEFINAGFLTYIHKEPKADLVISKAAMHHLPDFWKQIAFLNINKMLKLNGVFYLFDVVYDFYPENFQLEITDWINKFGVIAGDEFKKEIVSHIKEEFSTFSWIIKGMLEKAGFQIAQEQKKDNFTSEFKCIKIKECLY